MTTQNLTEHYESKIRKLNKRIAELEKVLNTYSSNSSLPSSKNRIGKKVVSNSREKSDKSIGGQKGHKVHKLDYFKEEETNLIKRLDKYKDNHLMFIRDFKVPFTNNTAERGLRQTKRKLAVSFLFKNINTVKDYANIISYIETCYRNNITRYDVLKRLVVNNPYKLEEMQSK